MGYIWVHQLIHFCPFHTSIQGRAGAAPSCLIEKVALHSGQFSLKGETETQNLQVMEVNPPHVLQSH